MVTTKFESTVESAYGKKLEQPVMVTGSYERAELSDVDALKVSDEWPSDEDIVKGYINPRRLASAKASATTKALDDAGVKKPEADSPEVIYRNLLRQFKLAKMDDATAETTARQISGFAG